MKHGVMGGIHPNLMYLPLMIAGIHSPFFAWHFGGFFWFPCQEKVLAGLRERLKNKVREAGLIGLPRTRGI